MVRPTYADLLPCYIEAAVNAASTETACKQRMSTQHEQQNVIKIIRPQGTAPAWHEG